MKGLQKNYSLQIVVATVLASVMILVTGNGIADSRNSKNLLPPPGPFANKLPEAEVDSAASGAVSSPHKPVAPVAQQGLNQKGISEKMPHQPKKPEIAHAMPKPGVLPALELKPVNKGIRQPVPGREPEFKREMPSIPQALATIKAPTVPQVSQPATPRMPEVKPLMPQQAVTPPPFSVNAPQGAYQPGSAPQLSRPMPPQQPLMPNTRPAMPPAYRANSAQPGSYMRPGVQQYRYIPLPVYQANYGYSRPPANGYYMPTPGFWVPRSSGNKAGNK